MAFRQAGELQTTSTTCLETADSSNLHKAEDTQKQTKVRGGEMTLGATLTMQQLQYRKSKIRSYQSFLTARDETISNGKTRLFILGFLAQQGTPR